MGTIVQLPKAYEHRNAYMQIWCEQGHSKMADHVRDLLRVCACVQAGFPAFQLSLYSYLDLEVLASLVATNVCNLRPLEIWGSPYAQPNSHSFSEDKKSHMIKNKQKPWKVTSTVQCLTVIPTLMLFSPDINCSLDRMMRPIFQNSKSYFLSRDTSRFIGQKK